MDDSSMDHLACARRLIGALGHYLQDPGPRCPHSGNWRESSISAKAPGYLSVDSDLIDMNLEVTSISQHA